MKNLTETSDYETILNALSFNCYGFTQSETKYVVIMFEV